MPTFDNQLTQPEFTSPVENQPMETRKPFSLSRRRLILISVVGSVVLLLIFGLGVRAGEKRALRKESLFKFQPSPTTNDFPSPTITSPPTPVNQSCFEGDDCVIGIEQDSQIIYSRGICKNGVCMPRPTSVPKREEIKE